MRPVGASGEQISGARMMAGNLPVVPSRASLSASGRAAAPSTVRNSGSQRFFGRRTTIWRVRHRSSSRQRVCGRRCNRTMWARFQLAGASMPARLLESTAPVRTTICSVRAQARSPNRSTNNAVNRTAGNPPSSSSERKPWRIQAVHAAERQCSSVGDLEHEPEKYATAAWHDAVHTV